MLHKCQFALVFNHEPVHRQDEALILLVLVYLGLLVIATPWLIVFLVFSYLSCCWIISLLMSETGGSACLSKSFRYTLHFLQELFRQTISFINYWRRPTCSWGFSRLSGSQRMISFWSCNRKRHSLHRLHCIQMSVSQKAVRILTPLHLFKLSELLLTQFQQLMASLLWQLGRCLSPGLLLGLNTDKNTRGNKIQVKFTDTFRY